MGDICLQIYVYTFSFNFVQKNLILTHCASFWLNMSYLVYYSHILTYLAYFWQTLCKLPFPCTSVISTLNIRFNILNIHNYIHVILHFQGMIIYFKAKKESGSYLLPLKKKRQKRRAAPRRGTFLNYINIIFIQTLSTFECNFN